MRPIEVFYHVFIPADLRAAMWTWWFDQQLGLIKQSKLADVAKVNLAVTMPKTWGDINGIHFRRDGKGIIDITFEEKVREYINTRYPWVNIINIRDTTDPNLYEGQTLYHIWERCQTVDIDVLYIHSKGVVSASPSVANWRDILNHYCISEWPRAVKHLDTVDAVGIKDRQSQEFTFSGNFWWSKSSHIKNLTNPIDTPSYTTDPSFRPNGPGHRYAFEYWIRTGNPTYTYLVDTKTDHFDEYCFLEDLLLTV